MKLTVHIAEIPSWVETALSKDLLDLSDGYEPTLEENSNDLLELLEQSVQMSKTALDEADEEVLLTE